MIKLYDFPQSPRVRKVRIVLAEKGLKYQKVSIDITKGEQKTPEFLAINPYGKVPALEDNGTTVYESTLIMEYLNDAYPNPRLLPSDSGQRARARVLMHYGDNPYENAAATLGRECDEYGLYRMGEGQAWEDCVWQFEAQAYHYMSQGLGVWFALPTMVVGEGRNALYESWLKGEFFTLTLEKEEIDEHTVWQFNKREK